MASEEEELCVYEVNSIFPSLYTSHAPVEDLVEQHIDTGRGAVIRPVDQRGLVLGLSDVLRPGPVMQQHLHHLHHAERKAEEREGDGQAFLCVCICMYVWCIYRHAATPPPVG